LRDTKNLIDALSLVDWTKEKLLANIILPAPLAKFDRGKSNSGHFLQ
tara:strand:- start:606 stop:746 length:141 start_codon:yes stop_codon:yes gene_type:complete